MMALLSTKDRLSSLEEDDDTSFEERLFSLEDDCDVPHLEDRPSSLEYDVDDGPPLYRR